MASRRSRRGIYGLALALLGLLIGLGIAEAWIRTTRTPPPRQIVRGFGLHTVGGVPVWEVAADRHNRGCVERHPLRTRILFFGSSITFGTDLAVEEVFTTALEQQLNELRPTPGFCVLNFAQPGFSFEQKYVVAQAEVARYQPALIMWESWVEWNDYRMIGGTAYVTHSLRIRPDGFVGIRWVPGPVNRLLFSHSRLYEYLTLAFGEHLPQEPGEHGVITFANERLIQVPRLADSVGAKLAIYLAPPLDRPFAELAAEPPDWHEILRDFAEEHGIPVYLLQQELIDHDYRELRLDPCCHFNAAGHRALVPIMARIVLEQLDAERREG